MVLSVWNAEYFMSGILRTNNVECRVHDRTLPLQADVHAYIHICCVSAGNPEVLSLEHVVATGLPCRRHVG